jgi:streptogramin lyase
MTRTRTLVLLALTALLLAGCRDSGVATGHAHPSTTAAPLHVVHTWRLHGGNAMVATPDRLWVLGADSGFLTAIDPATNAVVRRLRPPHPVGFGTYDGGSLWAVSFMDDTVLQLDADTGRAMRTIDSRDGRPFYRPVGITMADHHLWVVNHGDDDVRSSLVELDPATGRTLRIVPLPGHHAGGPTFAAGLLWVTLDEESSVLRVDPRTGHLVGAPISVDSGLCLSGSLAAGSLWLFGLNDDEGGTCQTVGRRLDLATGTLSPVRYGPGLGLYNAATAGGALWATDLAHTIYRVDVDSGDAEPALTLDTPDASNRLASAFGSLWVYGGETGRLTRIDVS